jgi:uncharacterized lipoprotein YajG
MSARIGLAGAGLAAVLGLAGCASRTLEIGYPAQWAHPALLAAVAPRRVAVAPVRDRRPDRSLIGARPEDAKPLVTARPVAEVVRDALLVELGANGHRVVPAEPGDVVLAADVEEFWLDAAGRGKSTHYVGRVAIAVTLTDGRGERLLTRRYVGLKRLVAPADSREAWRAVMDAALARTIRDVATDPEFAKTLEALPAAKASLRPSYSLGRIAALPRHHELRGGAPKTPRSRGSASSTGWAISNSWRPRSLRPSRST